MCGGGGRQQGHLHDFRIHPLNQLHRPVCTEVPYNSPACVSPLENASWVPGGGAYEQRGNGTSPPHDFGLHATTSQVAGTLPPPPRRDVFPSQSNSVARRGVRSGRQRTIRSSLSPLHIVTINTRSLLCERSIGLAETARSK
eukprot:1649215-Amphidinium_carterae.1